jgi:trans-aconitate methyltransferase
MGTPLKEHWETVYRTRRPEERSWTQETPAISLEFFHKLAVEKSANIIDIGGGDSKLVDHLLEEGFRNISVLDISKEALQRAQERTGILSENVKWIESDVLEFSPVTTYDVWHDRAVFHFLTDEKSIEQYLKIVQASVKSTVIIGTFSPDGPKKCSGLEVRQYDENSLTDLFKGISFERIECKRVDHTTPSGAVQNFQFCRFQKITST